MTNREKVILAANYNAENDLPEKLRPLYNSYKELFTSKEIAIHTKILLNEDMVPPTDECKCYIPSPKGDRCLGTKDVEFCICRGDTSKCDFYEPRW